MKEVYLIISDLHATAKEKSNRINYVSEVKDNFVKIIEIGKRYKKEDYVVNLIFLGDICDRSYSDINESIGLNNLFVVFNTVFNNCYTVMGNHEFSFYTDNPTWSLFSKIDSPSIQSIMKHTWKPQGIIDLLKVPDYLEVGDTVFLFNHYPTPILSPIEGKINIGLFHKDLAPKSIIREMENRYNLDIWDEHIKDFENTNLLDNYNYCFFGHNHKIYGKWEYINDISGSKSYLYHLASLLRPNHTEVNDDFLERNIPAVLFEDKKFIKVEDNLFNLPSRSLSVKEQVIKENSKNYKKKVENKKLIDYQPVSDDPVVNIENALVTNPRMYQEFQTYLVNDLSEEDILLTNKLEELKWKIQTLGL